VNIILLHPEEIARPLPKQDPRAEHILKVLRRQIDDTFDVGLINGSRGKATLVAINSDDLELTYIWSAEPPPADPLTLIIGLPRPQTARKILQEAATLGVSALHFVITERGESSYAQSTLWSSGEWKRHVHAGVAQAFCTRVPEVINGQTLEATIAALPPNSARLALDNYEATTALSKCHQPGGTSVVVALGAERGWSPKERDLLRQNNFTIAHLGERVLRLETAVTAAVAIIKAQSGLM